MELTEAADGIEILVETDETGTADVEATGGPAELVIGIWTSCTKGAAVSS